MRIKVVVIGSNGLLGQTLVNKLYKHSKYQLYAMASGENRNSKVAALNYFEIAITDFKSIKLQLNLIKPDFIINALAMTNVDVCEVEQTQCDVVNVSFVEQLARISFELGTHLIHISTDFIFDGVAGMYRENDTPNPINYYGLSKLKSEKVIQKTLIKYTILRTILVYGKVANMKSRNIVLWVKESLENKTLIRIVNDQFRMPTYVGSIADACVLAMEKQATGVYHISGNEYLSIYDLAVQIADFYNLPKELIQSIATSELSQKALRPPKTGFDLTKAIDELGFKPLNFAEGLAQFQNDL